MSDRIRVDVCDGIADVRLDRSEKLNALDTAMFRALIEAGENLAKDRSLRAVVLSGEGRGFCAGLDVANFAGDGGFDPFERDDSSPANAVQRSAWVWTELPVPVIAAVHGVCFGGGLQLALAADIRFATPDARLSVMEIKWGLVPDVTLSQTLPRLVRADVAKELTFTGRIVSGVEAAELGLVTHLSDAPHEAAHELAREIAGKSPNAVRAAKQLFDAAPDLSVAQGLRLEEGLQRGLLGKPNQIEAVKANLEKREPRFSDPD
ncbi:MAG: crotonase/enoyl-CoA hydratase family protein [Myxococcota bacterium]|jgi:enoyl-CoA hydratase/carnithine racemase|nr:enoyl-CoA hydratase [Deltaproteobacteria bacterium]MCP4242635.1 crotonase/enoyl-CoA hydratase family protein [bacterium]MDP6073407.1 crotonase/enoyl-CoA hydratase family protein [Myxococcota bacterium]MDP6244426.1 crotonase/enoyl-CoA hydratase family protein [Myxococcota bacterium]MDP7075599.1 crotonase/enoyl-CoA hydratase family protein [Myxococcota bacterium]